MKKSFENTQELRSFANGEMETMITGVAFRSYSKCSVLAGIPLYVSLEILLKGKKIAELKFKKREAPTWVAYKIWAAPFANEFRRKVRAALSEGNDLLRKHKLVNGFNEDYYLNSIEGKSLERVPKRKTPEKLQRVNN